MGHVAIYARKSTADEARVSVTGQVAEATRLAETLFPGVEVVEYVDNAVSGGTDDRPGLSRLLAAVEAGEVVGVIGRDQGRFHRDAGNWDRFVKRLYEHGITEVHTTVNGTISTRPGQRLLGAIHAATSADYLEAVTLKTRAAHQRLADEGRPHGGRAYGYRSVRGEDGRPARVIDEEQAAVVRRMADLVLAGVSTGVIARTLNEERVPTPRNGSEWRRQSVRSVLMCPAIAGYRTHHGELIPARWQPILEPKVWQQVCGRLTSNAPVVSADGRVRHVQRRRPGRPRKYLLTGGLAVCGECGSPMTAGTQTRRNGHTRAYECRQCRISITPVARVEEFVSDAVLLALDTPEMARALAAQHGRDEERRRLLAELADAEAVILEAAELRGAGELDRNAWAAMHEPAKRRADQARAKLDQLDSPDLPDIGSLRERWPTLTVAQRRAVLDLIIEAVTISRAKPGTRSFDPDRLSITWKV